jgi:methionyl-tRNA formyltransferase
VRVEREELNSDKVGAFIESLEADLALTYGVHFIRKRNLKRFPDLAWNLHGGLSPWYRGVITLFWPSYMLEPQMTGMTVHELSSRLDGGDIVHQACAPLVRGDGVHELACRAVRQIGEELPRLLELSADSPPSPVRQRSSGKL